MSRDHESWELASRERWSQAVQAQADIVSWAGVSGPDG